MNLTLDPLTMFLALVTSAFAAAGVLFWCYWLNRGERSLLWGAMGFTLGGVSSLLMAARETLPEAFMVYVAGATLLFGINCLIVAARYFNNPKVPLWLVGVTPALWVSLVSIPVVYGNYDYRVALLSALSAISYFVAARSFALRDGLLSRLPLVVILSAHALLCLARVPLTFADDHLGFQLTGPHWFSLTAFEALVFIQFLAFFMVSLAKERVERRLEDAALTDQLTGLGNRRAFFLTGESVLALAGRNERQLSIILFDLDRFKTINDRFGHPVGDAVIHAFARAAEARLRASDFVARLGGDEFAVVLPDTSSDHAALVAVHVSQAFEKAAGDLGYADLDCTVSAGVAHRVAGARSLEALMSIADQALYEAKALGRGQVRIATAEPRRGLTADAA